jgi:hypothetical protein
LDTANAEVISKVTIGVLLAWMGVDKDGKKPSGRMLATIKK